MDHVIPVADARAADRRRTRRMFTDRAFALAMATGGIGVLIAILLIFFYLVYVIMPLFESARLTPRATYDVVSHGHTVAHTALDEYAEVGFVVTGGGGYEFYDTRDGSRIANGSLTPATAPRVVTVARGDPAGRVVGLALADGSVVVARPDYAVSYPDDQRRITPSVAYPLGPDPLPVTDGQTRLLALQGDPEQTTVAAWAGGGRIALKSFVTEESLSGNAPDIETTATTLDLIDADIEYLVMDVDQRELYAGSASGYLSYYDIHDKTAPKLVDRQRVVKDGARITAIEFLSGGVSLLIGDSNGGISQWFPVRDADNNYTLAEVRRFDVFAGPVSAIEPEYYRKGFVAADDAGNVGFFHTTAHRTLMVTNVGDGASPNLAISPRGHAFSVLDDSGRALFFDVRNEHPEVSWRSLWGRVWYESRSAPEFIWQSSSASSDFEPKFSLTPLAFGTLKAAFYAMLFAVPLGILGALYTAYFMTAKMRSFVKPSIEIMAALPTVILGFLAGLWLAPLVEDALAGFFLAFFLVPAAVLLSCFYYGRLPATVRRAIPDGWEAALLIPVVCVAVWLSLALNGPLELAFFGGDLPHWLSATFGISYDQRNSLVVGMAIGFSVIPIIFSISEDAVFGVPRHLTAGSLALGATPWQTVVRVVLLTASPGIFSGVMIGFGRAVGETMIVLMATGNTPIMDFNIFQGFRALSANIAVEMPEAEVASTHYRVLFLAALVLFLATFVFNTIAEVVRQRLRVKYSSL